MGALPIILTITTAWSLSRPDSGPDVPLAHGRGFAQLIRPGRVARPFPSSSASARPT
jgi:hypothetical protein